MLHFLQASRNLFSFSAAQGPLTQLYSKLRALPTRIAAESRHRLQRYHQDWLPQLNE